MESIIKFGPSEASREKDTANDGQEVDIIRREWLFQLEEEKSKKKHVGFPRGD